MQNYTLKNNIKKDLKTLNFHLNDNFDFQRATSSDNFLGKGMSVNITITNDDKLKLIEEIKRSKNYKNLNTETDMRFENHKKLTPNYSLNYKYPEYYSRKIAFKVEKTITKIDSKINIR